jgi:hypothetical protein
MRYRAAELRQRKAIVAVAAGDAPALMGRMFGGETGSRTQAGGLDAASLCAAERGLLMSAYRK